MARSRDCRCCVLAGTLISCSWICPRHDVPLTVFQTLPVDGIVIVSSPQELVGMIVGKAVRWPR